MRKQHLFRGFLLFSSVLGVALTSQVTLPSTSNHHQLQLSVLTGSRALADTTTDSGITATDMDDATLASMFTKYSTIQKDQGNGQLSASDITLMNNDIQLLINQLISDANNVKPADTMKADFSTLTTDYVNYLNQNKGSYPTASRQTNYTDFATELGRAKVFPTLPTPTDIAILYYHNKSIEEIKGQQVKSSSMSSVDQAATLAKINAFTTQYPSLQSFGEAVYKAATFPKAIKVLSNATQPEDIDGITVEGISTSDKVLPYATTMLNMLKSGSGVALYQKNTTLPAEKWATKTQLDKANTKVDALTSYYTKILSDPNTTTGMIGAVTNTWTLAYKSIDVSATDDADNIVPATNAEKYFALKRLNAYADSQVVSTADKLGIDATSSDLTTDQQKLVDQIQSALQTTLSGLVTQVKEATTAKDLYNMIVVGGTGINALTKTETLTPITDADKSADEKAIDDAVTAQGKVFDADTQATDAQRTSYKNQISGTAANFKKGIESAKYKEAADTIVDEAVKNISSVTIPHSDGSGSTSTGSDSSSTGSSSTGTTSGSDSSATGSTSTSGKDSSTTDSSKTSSISDSSKTSSKADTVTATQKTNAINALISAGNTQKLAIQDDTSLTDAEKTAAYAAIDKLVSSYQTSLNAATNQEAFLAAQIGGLTAVNNYKAGSSSSNKTTITTPSDTATTTATTTTSTTPAKSSKGTKVVYATTRLKMYSDAGLTKHTVTYAKHARANRPEFTVFQTKTNDNGTKVYYVRNTASGRKGYISASSKYTSYAYYQTGAKKIKVISKSGVNAYKKSNLSSKQYHYKKGATLKIKKIVKSGLTTRFQLTNGTYVSANKIFVYTIA